MFSCEPCAESSGATSAAGGIAVVVHPVRNDPSRNVTNAMAPVRDPTCALLTPMPTLPRLSGLTDGPRERENAPDDSLPAERDDKAASRRSASHPADRQTCALRPLASQLPRAADGFRLLPVPLLGRLLVVVAHLHF